MAQTDDTPNSGVPRNEADDSGVQEAAGVLSDTHEEVHRHYLEQHPQPQPAPAPASVMGAQTSHGLMGSGGQRETHPPGQHFPHRLQKGELFQKIHSSMFIMLASVVASLDAFMLWLRTKVTQWWGTPVPVPYPTAKEPMTQSSRSGKEQDLAPAGLVMATTGGAGEGKPHSD